MLFDDAAGPHKHLLVVAGKEGRLYLLDRDALGKYKTDADDIVQSIKLPAAYGAAAYWNGHVFYTDTKFITRDFALEHGQLTEKAVTAPIASLAATPTVSSDGSENGIVWVLATKMWKINRLPTSLRCSTRTRRRTWRMNSTTASSGVNGIARE